MGERLHDFYQQPEYRAYMLRDERFFTGEVGSVDLEGLDLRSPWEKDWEEYNKPVRQSVEELLDDGQDLMTMTEAEVDQVYEQVLARRLEIGHRLFPFASPEDLGRRATTPGVIARNFSSEAI
ncbi:MAG: hypothetical protein Q8P92_01440 [Candidatus Daviesbacteria bacterium]|nr:hypothetical protein [Candidatus Daviesbacteria bacterium]